MDYNKLYNYSDVIYPNLLTKEEKLALKSYSCFTYRNINKGLREKTIDCDELSIRLLDSSIKKFIYDEPLIVYRDLGFSLEEKSINFYKEIEKGKYHEFGYMSTSLSEFVYSPRKNYKLIIFVPPFYEGALIRSLAYFKEENEYLLSRNTDLEILDISCLEDENKRKQKIIVKAKVIS